jgi:hypothetical protein
MQALCLSLAWRSRVVSRRFSRSVGEQAEALFEAQIRALRLARLFGQRLVHTSEAQLLELLQGGMMQHGMPPQW